MDQLCERGGGPGSQLLVHNTVIVPIVSGRKATLKWEDRAGSCVKEEVDQGSLSPNSPYSLCGCKAALKWEDRTGELCESGGGRPGLPVPNSPSVLCGHKSYTEVGRQN